MVTTAYDDKPVKQISASPALLFKSRSIDMV